MDIHLLMSRLNGEFLANKARVTIDGKIEILARLEGQEWVYTEKGKTLADLHSNLVVDEAAAKPVRASKKPAPAVESAEAPVAETAPEEQPPVAE